MNYDLSMVKNPHNSKEILWDNVKSLMQKEYGKENLWQFCKKCEIGPGTGTRIKECKTAICLDVLEKIADAFDLQPWHLLVPYLDPYNPPVVLISETEQRFYEGMKAASKTFAESI